jgi:hypothetical protein
MRDAFWNRWRRERKGKERKGKARQGKESIEGVI